ncbi:unnamed protein product [Paramecium sonneborni]|uniref:Photosystem I assembly protein Ycf3 n=1 Tax=Paramecium sonneborni TaxID=65129 RepID=A0A8S1R934_9CILI|nr:unnamed protein product [Paramecium sonneborni]
MDNLLDALGCLDYAIQKNPEDFQGYAIKANILNQINKFQEALEYYNYAIERSSNNSKLNYHKVLRSLKIYRKSHLIES